MDLLGPGGGSADVDVAFGDVRDAGPQGGEVVDRAHPGAEPGVPAAAPSGEGDQVEGTLAGEGGELPGEERPSRKRCRTTTSPDSASASARSGVMPTPAPMSATRSEVRARAVSRP